MSAPNKTWVLAELEKLAAEREAQARFWRDGTPIEQDDDETLGDYRERQADDEAHRRQTARYALEEDARANVLRQAIALIARG